MPPAISDEGGSGGVDDLRQVLTRARTLGFLGPGDIDLHIDHAASFAAVLDQAPTKVVDLGSGGGVPGLALAVLFWTSAHFLLIEGSTKRSAFLVESVEELGIGFRVEVLAQRAEDTGQEETRRGWADVVVSRSFGRPAVVAECAAPLLRRSGLLLVSEPPISTEHDERWPAAGVHEVGLRLDRIVAGPPALAILTQVTTCPNRYPRRVGIPAKRPLF